MNKKLLLRRPRYNISETIQSDKTIRECETRLTSFKEDIQPEIEALDREYQIYVEEDSNKDKIYLNELNTRKISKIIKNNEFSVVSICNIDEGLIPIKPDTIIKKTEKSNTLKISTKTVKQFEKPVNYFNDDKQIYSQNIFQQIEQQLPTSNQSIPKHILIIQLAALLKSQLANDTEKNVSCSIKSLPKFGNFPLNWKTAPKYEIILYENEDIRDLKSITPHKISDILQRDLMNANIGDNRKNDDISQEITPTKVSMMECLMTGKQYLNFSAHAISKLPSLVEIFYHLSILDLSYNNFKILPEEIYHLEHLHSLNLQNNPLQVLDDSISNLISLRILICSFTSISSIPSSIFRCTNLEQADLSYNNISHIPHVNGDNKLKVINLSGNPIRYFKKSFTKLNLERLGLENTWIDPIFWYEGQFALSDYDESWCFCDLCDQVINDFSINSIAFTRKYNHILPILTSFCSTLCKNSL